MFNAPITRRHAASGQRATSQLVELVRKLCSVRLSSIEELRRSNRFCIAIFFALLCGSAVFPSTGEAQSGPVEGGGFDLHLFRPAIDSKGQIGINGAEVLGHGDISFGLIIDGGFNIMRLQNFRLDETVAAANAKRAGRLVKAMMSGSFLFNVGLFNFLALGVQVPVQLVYASNTSVLGYYNSAAQNGVDYQGFGNLGFHAKARILRAPRGKFLLSAILQAEFPTGKSSNFAGEPGVGLWPSLVAEFHPAQPFRIDLNLGYRYNSGKGGTLPLGARVDPTATNATAAAITVPGSLVTYNDLITFGLGMSYRLFDQLDIVGEIYGDQIANDIGKIRSLSMEALGGLKIFVERNSFLMIGAGAGLTQTFQDPNVRGVLGFVFEPSIGDRDGDGIKDDEDKCPDVPEDLDDLEDEDGCPDPDNDKDGILDVDDACPIVPEDFDGDEDTDGCPEGDEGDRDGDGIPDAVDRCPDNPEDRDGFQDEDGCPEPDNDQDGILDKDDLCPNDPEDRDGFQDKDGCPDPDNDRDRIADKVDQCPNDPETYNGKDDTDGCPDKGLVIVEENQIIILEKIYFQTDSAEIQERSFPLLDAVAATLNGNPQIKLIEIQGHADERGNDDYNIRLTRDRAASVREALIQRGVIAQRMRSGGYGERCPVDPGHNATAWDKNRRVEFKILETDQGPTGVDIVCPAGRDLMPK